MTKYLVALILIALGAGYMFYDLRHPGDINKEIAVIKADKSSPPNAWGETLAGETTIVKKEKYVKPYQERPPQEEEVQEQAKEAPPVPEKKVENDEPMPPELNPGQEKNWEALQEHNKRVEQPAPPPAPEPELDGGPPPPQPRFQYGQYPCSYPDCPGNPDVERYLGRRWQWETQGPYWYGRGGPGGIDVQAPFFQLHIPPRYRYRRYG